MASPRRDVQPTHRVPLGEIDVNNNGHCPGADSKSLPPKSQCEATKVQQSSAQDCEHSNEPTIEIFADDGSEASPEHSHNNINNHTTDSSLANFERTNEPLSANNTSPASAQTLTFSNLNPPAEQTRSAKPIIKSDPSHLLSLTHAQLSHTHMAETPDRQRLLDTSAERVGGDISQQLQQQQGQGETSHAAALAKQPDHIKPTSPSQPSPRSHSPGMLANTHSKRSVSNKENIEPILRAAAATISPSTPLRNSTVYDALEAAVVGAATPPNSSQATPLPSRQQSIMEDDQLPNIEHLKIVDMQEIEVPTAPPAVEQTLPIPEDVPQVVETSHEIKEVPLTLAPQSPRSPQQSPPPRSKKNPGPRPTKASMARISLAHSGPQSTPRAPAWGPPRQSSGTSRLSMSSSQRIASDGSTASEQSVKREVEIPHSKPRPMSMCFPEPAPLPKSAKEPTRPTFQLPGEVVAQKLKAARELREKKDDDASKKVFKARPVPSSIKAAPAVRPTNTSRARESLGLGKDATSAKATPLHSRANSVAVVRPSDRKSSVSSRATSSGSDKPSTLGVSTRLYNPHRASMSMANISKPRDASPPEDALKTAAKTKLAPIQGKEVYRRHIFASELAEREKREKEEATKRARAEAAERSRLLSREWAAKKRQQQAGLKSETQVQVSAV